MNGGRDAIGSYRCVIDGNMGAVAHEWRTRCNRVPTVVLSMGIWGLWPMNGGRDAIGSLPLSMGIWGLWPMNG